MLFFYILQHVYIIAKIGKNMTKTVYTWFLEYIMDDLKQILPNWWLK